MYVPESRLPNDLAERDLCALEGPAEATEKPGQPLRDVERSLLRCLEKVVVVIPLVADLRGHAVEPLRSTLGAWECPVRNCARDSAVAVVERVNRHEPQVRDRCPENEICLVGTVVRPIEKGPHLLFEKGSCRSLVVDLLFPDGSGHDLHRPVRVVTPRADHDLADSAASCREQGRMPAEQAVGGQRLGLVLRRIDHHLHRTLDMTINGLRAAQIHTQTPGDG